MARNHKNSVHHIVIDFLIHLHQVEKIEIIQIMSKSGIGQSRGRGLWRGRKFVKKEQKGEIVKWESATKGNQEDLDRLIDAYTNEAKRIGIPIDSIHQLPNNISPIRYNQHGYLTPTPSDDPSERIAQFKEFIFWFTDQLEQLQQQISTSTISTEKEIDSLIQSVLSTELISHFSYNATTKKELELKLRLAELELEKMAIKVSKTDQLEVLLSALTQELSTVKEQQSKIIGNFKDRNL